MKRSLATPPWKAEQILRSYNTDVIVEKAL
jgi:hypothetical protein